MDAKPPAGVTVRPARRTELPEVRNVIDGAALALEHGRLRRALETGDVLVAATEAVVVGALVLADDEVTAVAVRPGRRGQGIGRALVEAAAAGRDRLVAECDERVAGFWRALGFELESCGDSRMGGRRVNAERAPS